MSTVFFNQVTPFVPAALDQFAFKSRYESEKSKVDLVLDLATMNLEQARARNESVAPFAAVLFDKVGRVKSFGVDSNGDSGHEVNNALINARKYLLGRSNDQATLVSLTPPCLRCFAQLLSYGPDKVITVTSYSDLARFFPEINPQILAPSNWQAILVESGRRATISKFRSQGISLLDNFSKSRS